MDHCQNSREADHGTVKKTNYLIGSELHHVRIGGGTDGAEGRGWRGQRRGSQVDCRLGASEGLRRVRSPNRVYLAHNRA